MWMSAQRNYREKKKKAKMRRHRDEEPSHIEKLPTILSPGANDVLRKMSEKVRNARLITAQFESHTKNDHSVNL
jgi:hypothetical protein